MSAYTHSLAHFRGRTNAGSKCSAQVGIGSVYFLTTHTVSDVWIFATCVSAMLSASELSDRSSAIDHSQGGKSGFSGAPIRVN